ncbi:MAG: glycine/betaine ABC transporter substrate-binding protein [Verrucomicrobia bacterium]|jgi:glycine betaine/proline transport system substrate-binding protein|nr:glycine/betaine ABC transporter substrate-binding protein [Verrucomicrobiota bacterium]
MKASRTLLFCLGPAFAGAGSLFLAGCGQQEESGESAASAEVEPVRLAYVEWSTEIASTHLVKAFFQEELGIPCRILPMQPREMWAAVAEGTVDGMVSAWLPLTHEQYFAEFGDEVVDLGPNLEGTRLGLVVPEVKVGRQTGPTGKQNDPLVDVTSIPELADHANRFNHAIIGIDPGAGIMHRTEEALETYGLEDRFELIQGDESSMVEALLAAIRQQRWVVVTGWEPHWLFGRYNLRFLEDPENVYGKAEAIHTLVRKGLQEDRPEVYAALDAFSWNKRQMNQLMSWIQRDEGRFAYQNAIKWMEIHKDEVAAWVPSTTAR